MSRKHSKEFRDYELGIISKALTHPMNKYELARKIDIKSLYMKLNQLAADGRVYRATKMVGGKRQIYYSLTAIHDEIVDKVKVKQPATITSRDISDHIFINGPSMVVRLSDYKKKYDKLSRNRVFVTGSSLGNAI